MKTSIPIPSQSPLSFDRKLYIRSCCFAILSSIHNVVACLSHELLLSVLFSFVDSPVAEILKTLRVAKVQVTVCMMGDVVVPAFTVKVRYHAKYCYVALINLGYTLCTLQHFATIVTHNLVYLHMRYLVCKFHVLRTVAFCIVHSDPFCATCSLVYGVVFTW